MEQADGFSTRAVGFLLRHWPSTALVTVTVVILMTPHALERFFVYYPVRELDLDPSAVGLDFKDVLLTTEDGVQLHGWHIPHKGSSKHMIIFHGNAGNIGHRVAWIEILHGVGSNLLIVDYRGYGKSEGKPFEQGLYMDARAAYLWWKSRYSSSGEVILFGESLGGAVAVQLASEFPVSGLILQSTFTTAWDMAKTLMPIGLLQPLSGVQFDSAAKITTVFSPKLFIHGRKDEIVPYHLGKKLFDLAPGQKDFYEVKEAHHNDLPWVAGDDYTQRIREFVSSLEGPRSKAKIPKQKQDQK